MSSLTQIFRVKKEDCISDLADYLPTMLGTYVLVKWMEIVSAKNINTQIDKEKYITFGQRVDIEHLQMVKLGEEVEIISTITEKEKRDIFFEIEAFNTEGELVARATHKRVLMPLKVVEKLFKG
jgi:predicted thioesterase